MPDDAAEILIDCFGRPVRLTAERLAHVREHPELVDAGPLIAQTLRTPERVRVSRSDVAALLFYRF